MIGKRDELLRYVVIGLLATFAHFVFLFTCIEVLKVGSAGLANMIASTLAISISFFGGRYFVFRKTEEPVLTQAGKFGLLYLSIALLHGAVMWLWSDHFKLDYKVGFVIATSIQMLCSYFGSRFLVFSK